MHLKVHYVTTKTKLHAFCRRTLFWLCFGFVNMNTVILLFIKYSLLGLRDIISLDGNYL